MKILAKLALVSIIAAVITAGAIAYSYLKPSAAPSEPIQAISVAATATPTAAAEPTAAAGPTTEGTGLGGATGTATSDDATIFEIVQEESEARFVIDEVLNGSPKTVVGTTNQVAGQIVLDPEAPGDARVGTIRINARTFTTDSDRRNRAIENRVLETGEYEYITFDPKELVGLPESVSAGNTYSFQIVGDLTIRDVTRETTFDVTVSSVTEDRLEGKATTTIRYANWDISIPQVPFVASVSDEVRLELDLVATSS